MGKKIVLFGEILMRLSTVNHDRLHNSKNFEVYYGGAEANVSLSLSQFGFETYFVSKVPDNELGTAAIKELKALGVNADYIKKEGEKIGIYFYEQGTSIRSPKVIYDRNLSSFSKNKKEDFNFSKIFEDCSIFYVSGITPSLSKENREITVEAIKEAKKRNITVAYDYNFRTKLWTREECDYFLYKILPYIDILIGYIPKGVDWKTINVDHTIVENGFKELYEKYDLKLITSTIRKSISASENEIYAVIYDGNKYIKSNEYDVKILNRIGGGDAFAAGIISEYLNNRTLEEIIEFAIAASAWKHTILTDYNIASREEILEITKGNQSGQIDR